MFIYSFTLHLSIYLFSHCFIISQQIYLPIRSSPFVRSYRCISPFLFPLHLASPLPAPSYSPRRTSSFLPLLPPQSWSSVNAGLQKYESVKLFCSRKILHGGREEEEEKERSLRRGERKREKE